MSWSVGAASALGTGLVRGEKTRRRRNAQKVGSAAGSQEHRSWGLGPRRSLSGTREGGGGRGHVCGAKARVLGSERRHGLQGVAGARGACLWLGLRGRGQVPLSPSALSGVLLTVCSSGGPSAKAGEWARGGGSGRGAHFVPGERPRRRLTRLCWSSPRAGREEGRTQDPGVCPRPGMDPRPFDSRAEL